MSDNFYLDIVNDTDAFYLDIVSDTSDVLGEIANPSIEIGMIGIGFQDPGPGVYAYDQTGHVWYPLNSRFFIRKPGDPVPPNLADNDIVLQDN